MIVLIFTETTKISLGNRLLNLEYFQYLIEWKHYDNSASMREKIKIQNVRSIKKNCGICSININSVSGKFIPGTSVCSSSLLLWIGQQRTLFIQNYESLYLGN